MLTLAQAVEGYIEIALFRTSPGSLHTTSSFLILPLSPSSQVFSLKDKSPCQKGKIKKQIIFYKTFLNKKERFIFLFYARRKTELFTHCHSHEIGQVLVVKPLFRSSLNPKESSSNPAHAVPAPSFPEISPVTSVQNSDFLITLS